jgi:predicted HD phosphohydrolase
MANEPVTMRANFSAMADGTAEDWAAIKEAKRQFNRGLPERALAHLKVLEGQHWGFAIDRLSHSLQSATLAHHAGMDEEYVVCALLHDIGYTIGPWTHSDVAAAMLRPYVSRRNLWMVAHHHIFEGYYFLHHFGGDRNAREQFRGHPCFEPTADFCERFDQVAFDPAFTPMPLDAFEPMVNRVLSRRKRAA